MRWWVWKCNIQPCALWAGLRSFYKFEHGEVLSVGFSWLLCGYLFLWSLWAFSPAGSLISILTSLFLRRIYAYIMYTVYTPDWLDVLLTGSSSVVESWLGSVQLPHHYVSYHLFIPPYFIDTHTLGRTHSKRVHARRDCVRVIYVYTWESVWQGVSRMCVYLCVECTHSPKHLICFHCRCVCEYKHLKVLPEWNYVCSCTWTHMKNERRLHLLFHWLMEPLQKISFLPQCFHSKCVLNVSSQT